jgi:hypothetical protein
VTGRFLLSFDIDGTLSSGDPPGPLAVHALRQARALGHVVGTSSDRTIGEQRAMWTQLRIGVDFVGRKHELSAVRGEFACDRYLHVGDTIQDERCARRAGFEFLFIDELVAAPFPWLARAVPAGEVSTWPRC